MRVVSMLREWTLPVAMAAGIGGYLLFHLISALDPIAEWYAPIGNNILPAFMFLILYIIFCKTDFGKLRPACWHAWVGVLQMSFVLLLMIVIRGLQLSGATLILFEAILAIVICPCAAAAPVVTMKLGGSLEQMTTYTFLSNILSALLIPLCFPLLPGAETAIDTAFMPLFLGILWKVTAVLLLPMMAAWLTKTFCKTLHHKVVSVKDLSYYMWAFTLMLVSGTTVRNIAEAWEHTSAWLLVAIALMALLVCLIQYSTGWTVGQHFGRRIEAGQGMGQKNTAFAIWASTLFLTPLSSVGPGCYILWQNTINSLEIHQKEKASRK